MNFSMFLPQTAEQDSFDVTGRQQDDINSAIEYINQIILGNHDDTPEDEDDDSGQNFSRANIADYISQKNSIFDEQKYVHTESKDFPQYIVLKLACLSFEIVTPPPEA